MSSIAFCKIFPPIGIARLGNSRDADGFYIGPEGLSGPTPKSYKDTDGAVLRQGARFRVFGFDEAGDIVDELTADTALIQWTVHLANKKASWFAFDGAAKALQEFNVPGTSRATLRNHTVTGDARARLDILPQKAATIGGRNVHGSAERGEYALVGTFQHAVAVYLGELRTDADGHLIVLGGRGHSAAIDVHGKDVSGKQWITNYANNDLWHDDTSDGPVTATVTVDGRSIPVKGRAWVIVAPPDFAPDIANLITLHDVMEEVVLDAGLLHPGLPAPRGSDAVEYWQDVHPILARAMDYRWVSALGQRGHDSGKGGDFSRPDLAAMKDPASEAGRLARQAFFARVRTPHALATSQTANDQANGYYMPPLSGDEGDAQTGSPSTWLTLTALQYNRLKAWADGLFTVDDSYAAPPMALNDPWRKAGILTRTALECCVGGAFFPGIEMTSISRSARLYSEAFRLADELEPGDVTKYMACPWQADFYECNTHWWPAQRPDGVITEEAANEIADAFDYERGTSQLGQLMTTRLSWARGVGTVRPDLDSIKASLLSEPSSAVSAVDYLKGLAERCVTAIGGLFDTATRPSDGFSERVPSRQRIQFVVQEQFDRFGGRYFHFVVPAAASRNASDRVEDARSTDANERYVAKIKAALSDYCADVVRAAAAAAIDGSTAYLLLKSLAAQSAAAYESSIQGEIAKDSPSFAEIRWLELLEAAQDNAYLSLSGRAGDNDMVTKWSTLGFAVAKGIGKRENGTVPFVAHVEVDRSRYKGREYREYYYMLCNIEQFPDMYAYSATLVDEFLDAARIAIDRRTFQDGDTIILETFFDYDPITFGAKLDEIYEYYRSRAAASKPWEQDRTRSQVIKGIVKLAPFNQNDGAWLRFVANSGPTDEVRSLLFEIWSDEFGNGDPNLHHGNLYTALIRSLNVTLPDVSSREYADSPLFSDVDFASPVFQLAISQQADRYMPEILGMTLYLEWEVLQLAQGIKLYDYLGIDSQFWRMHVGIDNSVDGHGAKARKAIENQLDHILKESGREAMHQEWKRIWTGFVAFATAGLGYMGDDDDVMLRRPEPVTDRMLDMIARKQRYGSLNHGNRKLGMNRINDWFDDPQRFLDELEHSAWIVPGQPDDSRVINYLTTFEGPMYKVFSPTDLALWREWIGWLGQEGDTRTEKRYQTKAESMLGLLEELRSSAVGTDGHLRYKLAGRTLHDWFTGDLRELMRALARPDSPWVTPWDAGSSALVRDFASANGKMAAALDQRFPRLGNQIGRLIAVRWVNAGCPLVDQPAPVPAGPVAARPVRDRRATLVEVYGQGSVH